MSGDAGIIAPYFLQQRLARHRELAGTVQKAEDRGLLLGQPHFPGVGAGQHLGAWAEAVGTDRKHRVFAGFMLTELRPDSSQQHREAKWLRHIIISAGLEPEDGV